MYTYRPRRSYLSTLIDRVASQYQPLRRFSTRFVVTAIVIIILGISVIIFVPKVVYNQVTAPFVNNDNGVYAAYELNVVKQTDQSKLGQAGEYLLKKQLYPHAALAFKRAADLDPNYRDAAYGWAYAILQDKQTKLTAGDLQDIHDAIKRAEAVDPLYIPLLKLKLLMAEIERDQDTAQLVQSRLRLLGEK